MVCILCAIPSGRGQAINANHQRDVFVDTAPEPGWLGTDPVGARITWTGCAGFILEFGGTRICFDPFVSNPGLRRLVLGPPIPDVELIKSTFGTVAAAFIGHTHYDHAMDVATVIGANPAAIVYGSTTTAEICRRQGLLAQQVATAVDGQRIVVGPFTIEPIASEHGNVPLVGRIDPIELRGPGVPRSPLRWPRGDVFAWRVEFAGLALHVQTSAGIAIDALARQSHADILIACLAARHGTPSYFERLGKVLTPRVVIPCHHDNFLYPVTSKPRAVPQLDWRAFLDDVAALEHNYGTTLIQLPRAYAVDF